MYTDKNYEGFVYNGYSTPGVCNNMPDVFNQNTESMNINTNNTPGCWIYTQKDVRIAIQLNIHPPPFTMILKLRSKVQILTDILIKVSRGSTLRRCRRKKCCRGTRYLLQRCPELDL